MRNIENLKNLFTENAEISFDFSQAPDLIKRKSDKSQITTLKTEDISLWAKLQNEFILSTKSRKVFNKDYIKGGKKAYDGFFKKRGFLQGNVLDIGGGWGLFRQWWNPTQSDFFIVHDPGIERFLNGPHQFHYQYYLEAFNLPMTFVEGFGEELPYKDNMFDTCLTVAVLEHCVNPRKVLKEAYRCLKIGGTILVIINYEHPNQRLLRLMRYILHPKAMLDKIYSRFTCRVHQMHSFTPETIISLLKQTGFSRITVDTTPGVIAVDVYEGKK